MMKRFSMSSFVGGLILGAAFVGAWMGGDFSLPSVGTPSPAEALTTKIPSLESGAISVVNQPAGSTVVIESLTVPPPGVWVAVRDAEGNNLGNVLGAIRVSGPRTDVSLPLLRATEPGLSYAVELYRDDGQNAFDAASDSVYVDFATGAPVIAYFSTTN